jgi:hypothetical protein
MSEPAGYKSVKECGLKFLSNITSFKYQAGAMVTMAFFMHLVPWYAWLPSLMCIAGIRGYEKFLVWGKRKEEVEPTVEVLPEVTPIVEG